MDSERIKTGLYNRAKNSNNNVNHSNPLTKKSKVLNVNSINFLKNKKIENEDEFIDKDNETKISKEQDITTNYKIISNNIYNEKLILPKINQNNPINKKILPTKNTPQYKEYSSKQNLKENEIIKTFEKNNINKRIPSSKNNSKNILEMKKEINNTNNNSNNKIIQGMNKGMIKLKNNVLQEEDYKKQNSQIKKPIVRKFKTNAIKEFLKESSIKSIQLFLDPKNLKNFILACKKFYAYSLNNDDLWFNYYAKKYKIDKTKEKYNENRGKWREVFIKSIKKIFYQNYDQIKNKFLKNFNKNKYQVSKDPYNIPNLVYNYMKPKYNIEIDGKIFPVKHIFTNKILSHINFFINFDQEYLDYRKANKIKLLLNEKNLGFSDINIYEIELKKKKFLNLENEGIKSNICNIFSYNEFIFSTFEKNFIFFINISLSICKICEIAFDFLKGIHSKNLLYQDDISKDFGLYDYVLLINIKSWKDIFFTLHINKLDFKKENDDDYLLFENDSRSI